MLKAESPRIMLKEKLTIEIELKFPLLSKVRIWRWLSSLRKQITKKFIQEMKFHCEASLSFQELRFTSVAHNSTIPKVCELFLVAEIISPDGTEFLGRKQIDNIQRNICTLLILSHAHIHTLLDICGLNFALVTEIRSKSCSGLQNPLLVQLMRVQVHQAPLKTIATYFYEKHMPPLDYLELCR